MEMTALRRRRPTGPDEAPIPGVKGPRWAAQLVYALVAGGVAGGLVLFGMNHFRKASALFAFALLCGAAARLLLPEGRVGMLATRKRWVDVLTLVFFAVAIAAVALIVPPK